MTASTVLMLLGVLLILATMIGLALHDQLNRRFVLFIMLSLGFACLIAGIVWIAVQ